jgi:hypothetical protein
MLRRAAAQRSLDRMTAWTRDLPEGGQRIGGGLDGGFRGFQSAHGLLFRPENWLFRDWDCVSVQAVQATFKNLLVVLQIRLLRSGFADHIQFPRGILTESWSNVDDRTSIEHADSYLFPFSSK